MSGKKKVKNVAKRKERFNCLLSHCFHMFELMFQHVLNTHFQNVFFHMFSHVFHKHVKKCGKQIAFKMHLEKNVKKKNMLNMPLEKM